MDAPITQESSNTIDNTVDPTKDATGVTSVWTGPSRDTLGFTSPRLEGTNTTNTANGTLAQPLIPVDAEFYIEMNAVIIRIHPMLQTLSRASPQESRQKVQQLVRQHRPGLSPVQCSAVAGMCLRHAYLNTPPDIPRRRIHAYLTLYALYAARLHSLRDLAATVPTPVYEDPAALAPVLAQIARIVHDPAETQPSESTPSATMPATEAAPFIAFMMRHRYTAEDALSEQARLKRKLDMQLDATQAAVTSPRASMHLAPQTLTHLHRQGFLMKRGHVVKNWKRRWVVCGPDTLQYFVDQHATKPKGTVQMRDVADLILPEDAEFGRPYCIQLSLGAGGYFLMQCATYAELKAWLDTFHQIIAYHQQPVV
eukprot:TRINITY_DN4190_c0_g1_i1.p1 TRINITY_DN4190_c0_g1~~TRINITY_DN4190_c0_g1_i1.p1  ORF type:complete len:368 (+),score=68.87 TRINITY_DN4190_c0_g1_i1:62-1165(+)